VRALKSWANKALHRTAICVCVLSWSFSFICPSVAVGELDRSACPIMKKFLVILSQDSSYRLEEAAGVVRDVLGSRPTARLLFLRPHLIFFEGQEWPSHIETLMASRPRCRGVQLAVVAISDLAASNTPEITDWFR